MTLQEIKDAVLAGKTVHWCNPGYRVIMGNRLRDWLIVFDRTGEYISLTWSDEGTLNGEEKDFYIA